MNGSRFDRFDHSWPGYRAVLRSAAVRADLQARADAIAQVARTRVAATGNEGSHVTILADTTVGRNRAGATVIGVPMHLERKHRILGSAIDAGRGGS